MKTRFIERMTLHWKDKLSLPCTNALLEGWAQLEQAIETASTKPYWQVIPLPTGTGKTEALITLCATPTIREHPSALIITRFKQEADRIANEINKRAGATIALASHGSVSVTSNEMAQSAVLVITHVAYRNALREAQDRPDSATSLALYHSYHQTERRWIIVDEAFDWIDAYEVELNDLSAMCGALSAIIPDNASYGFKSLLRLSQSIDERQREDSSDKPLTAEQLSALKAIDLTHLRTVVRELPREAVEIWRNAELRRRTTDLQPTTFKQQYIDLLARLQAIQQIGRCWLSQRGSRVRLHGSRSLLSAGLRSGVILDATAGIDRSYDLLGERVLLQPRPRQIRSYNNVTIHVSRSHQVGKAHLIRSAKTSWPLVARQLSLRLTSESKVLIITHMSVAPIVRRHGLKCGTLDVQHWGALDGKNHWSDYDTVVVFGLPYLDDITPTNNFLSCTHVNAVNWFEAEHRNGRFRNTKTAIKLGFIAKSVVQAINRVHCRNISDDQGNCKATDVFILLPSGDTADSVTASIQQEMPGSKLLMWHAAPVVRKPLARTDSQLLTLMGSKGPGSYGKSQTIAQLSISTRTFERMSVSMQKPNSALMRELAAIGVQYNCNVGSGMEACFIKH